MSRASFPHKTVVNKAPIYEHISVILKYLHLVKGEKQLVVISLLGLFVRQAIAHL